MKKSSKAITLIEIMVVITIMWILMIWSISLWKSKDIKTNSQIAASEIKSWIEEIQFNSISWKWVNWTTDLINPDFWTLKLKWDWTVTTNYTLNWTEYLYKNLNIPGWNNRTIIEPWKPLWAEWVTCETQDWIKSSASNNETISINFKWPIITNVTSDLWLSCIWNPRYVRVDVWYLNSEYTSKIQIDRVASLITVSQN